MSQIRVNFVFQIFTQNCINKNVDKYAKSFTVRVKKASREMEKFSGTIAVVTGASSGIGLGIVKKLLESKELEVVGFSRREMTLSEPNFRKFMPLYTV